LEGYFDKCYNKKGDTGRCRPNETIIWRSNCQNIKKELQLLGIYFILASSGAAPAICGATGATAALFKNQAGSQFETDLLKINFDRLSFRQKILVDNILEPVNIIDLI